MTTEVRKSLMIVAREIVQEVRSGMLPKSKARKLWQNTKSNFGVLDLRRA